MTNVYETAAHRVKFPGGTDGVELAGIVDHPKPEGNDAAPRGPVVIFSHCFTCNKDLKATVRISRALARTGATVLRFDMMGLGGSSGDFSQSNFTTNLADLAAAVRFAETELGPVGGLIGHSFGGIAALVTAGRMGDVSHEELPLHRLGFVATLASPSDTQHLATLLTRMSPEIESAGEGTVTIGGFQYRIRRQMIEDFRRHDVPASLARVRCPVLLMHSPVDETVGFDQALRLMSLIQTPRDDSTITPVSLVAIPDADHLLLKDAKDLQFVADLIASYCRRYG